MHPDEQALLLDLFDRDDYMVPINYLHALCVNNILIIRIFLVETELHLFETSEVIQAKYKRLGLGRLLN